MHPNPELLISDVDVHSEKIKSNVIYWSQYLSSESDGIFSLPLIVEQNAKRLKTRYLGLIYEFGEEEVNGQRIIDHLKIRKNFSYWWMTLLVEKCNYAKSPQIDNIIKLMALEYFFQENEYKKLKLLSSNSELAKSISLLANRLQVDFEWQKERNTKFNSINLYKIFQALPNIIKSPIWLIHFLYSNWALKGVGVKEWRNTNASSTFVSYLFNLAPDALKEGRYESRYWTSLTDLMDDNNHPSNWLHIYVKDGLLPSAKKARKLIQKFNSLQKNHQVHVTLASFLTVPLIFRTIQDWYKVFKLNKLVCEQVEVNSGYLWPLFKKDCQDSMSGIPAISNLLYYNLFEKAMSELPVQKRGCYLLENQGWEFGLINAWQSAGHKKKLTGFPHTVVRYWYLTFYFDPLSYKRKGQCMLPLPDYLAVNGEPWKNMYLDRGYPLEDLIEVEALRYMYLSNFSVNQDKIALEKTKEKTVLVAGDYLKENTDKQLNLLSSAITDIDESIRFIFKPHPSCPVNIGDFPSLSGELSSRPIQELMKISDVVYTSLVTAAAVDAYCAGLPVISFLDGKTLNVSPLRDAKGVYFVTNSKSLAKAINTFKVNHSDQKTNYFYLDSDLPGWHKWLTNDFDKDNFKSE